MRDLSATLLAAQKKPDRLPYIELEVRDFEQGIKRLTWTRLYQGSEPDNHHGIAFDGEGSMHRIRAEIPPSTWQASTAYSLGALVSPTTYNGHKYECTTAGTSGTTEPTWPTVNGNTVTDGTVVWTCRGINLYRQKVTTPGEASDYSQWVVAADDCYGPCAIAASGAKVYIFYRTTANVLWKHYSHDYGATWSNAQLAAIADVQSLSATWWAPGDIVVCFALYLSAGLHRINGITLDTTTQTATEHEYTLSDLGGSYTYGIGSTYFSNKIAIILAGRWSGDPYNFYALCRTEFSDTYNFLAPDYFLTAPDGEDTTYEYPDCHIPQDPQSYETLRITAAEKFTGTTAYTRPFSSHMVKSSAFSEMAYTEPRPFLDLTSDYGLRITTSLDYWWLERPDGVWRAPRAAGESLVLTTHQVRGAIVSLTHHASSGTLAVDLDNSRGTYANPGQGSLAQLKKFSELILKLGYKTTAGNETSEAGTYWVNGWEYSSQPALSRFTLLCIDGSRLIDNWSARHQMRWNATAVGPKSVWQILKAILSRVGILLTNTPPKPQSSPLNNFYPDFTIPAGSGGTTAIRRLLSFVPDILVFRSQEAFTKNPLSDETSCYSYDVTATGTWQSHPILTGFYGELVHPSHALALGRDASFNRIVATALDWPLLDLGIDILKQDYDPNLANATRTQERADAILRKHALEALGGQITIPTNVGQELLDVVTLTDARCGITSKKHRIRDIVTAYDWRKQTYQQKLTLAAL